MLYKYIFGEGKKKSRRKSTKKNAGRNLTVLEDDKLSSQLPFSNLQDISALLSAGFVEAAPGGHSSLATSPRTRVCAAL